jgi:hypothetical protein
MRVDMTSVGFSQAPFTVNEEHMRGFYVEPRGRGLRVVGGPCPRCAHHILIPLGPPPRPHILHRLPFLKRATRELRPLTFECGCGEPHPAAPDEPAKMGCGVSWNVEIVIPEQASYR